MLSENMLFLEINEYEITEKTLFFVIASDGVWEFLTNKQILDLVMIYYEKNNPSGAADRIVEEATKCWRRVIKKFLFIFYNSK